MAGAAGGDQVTGRALYCFAVREEARFCPVPRARRLVTGMGLSNTARALESRLAAIFIQPAVVFSCGFAGALDPRLATGTVLFDVEDADWSLRLEGTGARRARFHCADRVAVSASEKRALRERTGADAVEMESAAVGEACGRRGIAWGILRVVSDAAEEDLPLDFNRLMTAGGRLRHGRLMWELLRAPGRIASLMRLGRVTRDAARRLGEVVARIDARAQP